MDAFKKYFRCCFPFASPGSRKPSARPGDITKSPLPEGNGPSSPVPTPGSPGSPGVPGLLLPPGSPTDQPDLQPISEEQVCLSERENLGERFLELLGDREELDAYDLKDILDDLLAEYGHFSTDSCRSMVALGDSDVSGKLDRQEAVTLVECLNDWQEAFHKVDSDNKGYIFGHEIDLILELLDVKLPKKTVMALNLRYSDKEGHINFIDLVQCLSRLAGVMAHFSNKVNDRQHEKASFKMDEYIRVHLYS